jgi:hypothetical protein
VVRLMIRSGGQSGVDRAALDGALRQGVPYGGWCPKGGWAEDHADPPGVLAAYPRLVETPSSAPEQRTAWNVRDSHGTLILARGAEWTRSPGVVFTRQCADLVFLRPCLIVDLAAPGAADLAREWLSQAAAAFSRLDALWVNVAGPRESEAPGIYVEAGRLLERLLARPRDARPAEAGSAGR